eukprot:gene5816-8022_t
MSKKQFIVMLSLLANILPLQYNKIDAIASTDNSIMINKELNIYTDQNRKFSILIPPSWFVLQKKDPASTMTQFQAEEVLLTANSFAEGASLSVTKTNPNRLLKDFDIEWWFAPIKKMSDIGPPELIANLLVLQRQGEFIKRITPSTISDAKIIDNVLTFEFSTPLAEGIDRKTIVKAILYDSNVLVNWVSIE